MEGDQQSHAADSRAYDLLRPLGEADATSVARVLAQCGDYMEMVLGREARDGDAHAFLAQAPPGCAAEDTVKLAIVSESGEIIGIVDLVRAYPDPVTWFIGLVLIVPPARGRGVGRRVMDEIYCRARRAKVKRLALSVYARNTKALRFWRALGFTVREMRPRSGMGRESDVRFEMTLDVA